MDFDLIKASGRLSELDIKFAAGSLDINVLWLRVMSCSSDSVIEMHSHSTFEFHFVHRGSSCVELKNGSFEAGKGSFYVTAPGVCHRQYNRRGYVEFSLNCELSLRQNADAEGIFIIDTLKNAGCKLYKDTAGSMDCFCKALEEAYYMNVGYYSNIQSLTAMILTSAARAVNGPAPVKYGVPVKKKKEEHRFNQIRNFILDNITIPITTSDVARYLFLGEKQVSRIVKNAADMSTKEFIQELKFQKAKALILERPELTIRQIADMLGFSSEYYFNQFFKRREGYPPGVFRANIVTG